MKHGRTTVVCVLSGTLLAPAAFAASNPQSNNYDRIAASNPFRLKPIPPPPPVIPPVVEVQKEPASKLILQGITDILGVKMALLEVQPAPPNNTKISHLTLSEGERSGDIEIVSIDEVAGTVRVKNQGRPDTLDFSVATKTVAASMPAAVIPGARPGVTPIVTPTSATPSIPLPAPAAVQRSIPLPVTSRQIRSTTSNGLTPMTPNTLPSLLGGGVAAGGAAVTPAVEEAPLTPGEQIIMMEINRELTKEKVIRRELPPIPPTPITPPGMP